MRILLLTLALAVAVSAAEKKVITPKEFPAGRPYSAGLMVDGTLYVAGQVGQDWKTGKAPDDFEAEVKQTLDNVGMILKAAGIVEQFADEGVAPEGAQGHRYAL